MAIFSDIQHPVTFTFGILGNIVSFMVYLAPAPTFYSIVKRKSTQGFLSVPYVVALFSSMIWIYYATLKTDATLLITINAVGCIIETLYTAIFIAYAPKTIKIQTIKLVVLLNFVAFWVIALSTHFLAEGPTRVEILGWICMVISVSVYAAPLSIMKKVIQTKSVEFMPFWLSFYLALSAVMWFFYGLLQKDIYVALPNIIGFVLGIIQMVLYLVYKNYNTKNINFEKNLPTSVSTLERHHNCDMPKHKEKETNTKDQTVTVKCSKEQSNIEVKVDEPLEFCTLPKIINDLIDNTMKEGTMLETSTSCTSIVQQINVLEDHNQTKSMDAPHQAYLVESAT
ncbi:bidirectional sugar transporter N3 [Lactuca sativa]|uniref:Bidirectional sugar transporter SWEET n=1 Tax=Lactuca sativa TaxID=4236 RepID=A0A9R1VHJ8_LACSA|nr:bidirectional sugar transporter N3 [Lactuca sativa]KAJ0207367.1 hypothetical protein LSAT_V11C500233280 [Lactuca sativa]